MDAGRDYIISVIVCTLCCGLISSMTSGSGQEKLIHFICGVIVVVTVLRPISAIELPSLSACLDDYRYSAQEYVHIGENLTKAEQERYIKEACEAYICSVAEDLVADISVHVQVDTNLMPAAAEITGRFNGEVRNEMEHILETDLGITKENQLWIMNQEDSSS